MKIETLDIPELLLLTPKRFEDSRGYFSETFRQNVFEDAAGSPVTFVQDNQSYSEFTGTVRGLHYQAPPDGQGKLVRCVQGRITDVAVDIRAGSPTYGQHVSVILSAGNGAQLWVPAGFLHGFATLTPRALVQYKCTAYYNAACEGAVLWNDTDLNIDWGLASGDGITSDKDGRAQTFADFKTPFSA